MLKGLQGFRENDIFPFSYFHTKPQGNNLRLHILQLLQSFSSFISSQVWYKENL